MTITMPRERLVRAGNKVLDAAYEEELFNTKYADTLAILRDKTQGDGAAVRAMDSLPEEEKTVFLLGMLTHATKRESAVKEYVTIRETIEAMSADRTALPEID